MANKVVSDDVNAIVVNVKNSLKGQDALQASSGEWPATRSQIDHLMSVNLVIAVVANVIRGVFKVVSSSHGQIDEESSRTATRVSYELVPAPAYSGLMGHRLRENGTYWKQGDGAAWKTLPVDELGELTKDANVDRVPFGPHFITLRPDGNLDIDLAEGTSVNVRAMGKSESMREQIARVVHAVAEAGILCTYGAIADMVGNAFTPSVARSIVRNKQILPEEAAHVLPQKFFDGKNWVVPMDDPEWTSVVSPDGPQRSELLIDRELASQDGNVAIIEDHLVIWQGATLRRYLNI